MRRHIFLQHIEKHQAGIVRTLVRADVEEEHAVDAVQDMVRVKLEAKAYKQIPSQTNSRSMRKFLLQAARWQVYSALRKQQEHAQTVLTGELDPEQGPRPKQARVMYPDPRMCPFCFYAELNEYGACGACGTILGDPAPVPREGGGIEDASFTAFPDLSLVPDINYAIEQLEPDEQKIIRIVMNNVDTLKDYAGAEARSYSGMLSVYSSAKRKLRTLLAAYS